jgi:uncharacterized membrane protein
MIDNFHYIVNLVSFSLNIVGALIIIWGAVIALSAFLLKEVTQRERAVALNEDVRLKLGSYLILALEYFIASDIIRTIITPTWEGVGMLGAIVAIRTVLSYFLTADIKKKN